MASFIDPLFCYENLLPSIFGAHNFWATLTSVPMWIVPVSALRAAHRQRAPRSVMAWLGAMAMMFLSGTIQHMLGPDLAGVIDPVIFGNVQNTLLAGHLTGAPLPVSTTLASLPVVFALCLSDERHRMVGELVQGLLAPYVAVTMGYRSWPNPQCWRLFVLALISMLAVFAFQAVEPRLCGLPGAVLWHSVVIHLVIVSTFGSVAFLGLRLLKVDTEHKKAE